MHKEGSPALNIGTILLDFSASWKIPDLRLLLKMCANGTQIFGAMSFSRDKLIPSISVLDLLVSDLIMSIICAGFIYSNSNGIWIGFFSTYVKGSLDV